MHNLNFSDHLLGGIVVLKNLRNQFDGNNLAGCFVLSLDNLSERTLADVIEDFVLGFDVFPDAW